MMRSRNRVNWTSRFSEWSPSGLEWSPIAELRCDDKLRAVVKLIDNDCDQDRHAVVWRYKVEMFYRQGQWIGLE